MNSTLLNGRCNRVVAALNTATRKQVESAHAQALNYMSDFTLPAFERVTWKNLEVFLRAELERF